MKRILFLLTITLILTSCGTYRSLNLNDLSTGMSIAQVEAIAGSPYKVLATNDTYDGYQVVLAYRTYNDDIYALEFWDDYLVGYEYLYSDVQYVPAPAPPAYYPPVGRPVMIINNRPNRPIYGPNQVYPGNSGSNRPYSTNPGTPNRTPNRTGSSSSTTPIRTGESSPTRSPNRTDSNSSNTPSRVDTPSRTDSNSSTPTRTGSSNRTETNTSSGTPSRTSSSSSTSSRTESSSTPTRTSSSSTSTTTRPASTTSSSTPSRSSSTSSSSRSTSVGATSGSTSTRSTGTTSTPSSSSSSRSSSGRSTR